MAPRCVLFSLLMKCLDQKNLYNNTDEYVSSRYDFVDSKHCYVYTAWDSALAAYIMRSAHFGVWVFLIISWFCPV